MSDNEQTKNKGPVFGTRHVQALLLFFCFVVNFIDRLKTSVTLVAMTDAASTNPSFPEYDWNKKEKGYILSSFYWGAVLTQFLGSFMCHKFGAKVTMLISTLGSGVLNFFIPMCIPLGGWQIYTVISMFQGMFQGLFVPCVHEHIAKWSPIEERNRLGGFSLSGLKMGTILAMGVPGLIAKSSWGWPGISYVSGGLSVSWCILWAIFADNSTNVSRFISPEEKHFIQTSQQKSSYEAQNIPNPWKAIFTSIPFVSLIIIESAQAFGFKTIQNEIPSYLHGVLRMDITSNSLFSALPYLAMFVTNNLYFILADYVMKKELTSLLTLRRTVSTISTWIPAAALVGVGFLNETQKTLAIVLLTTTVGINGGDFIGSGLNAIDLSSNHAAILIGIIKTATSVVFMVTPLFVAAIVGDGTDRSEWLIVFVITALVLFFGNLQYILLGRTDTQPWDSEKIDCKVSCQQSEKNESLNLVKQPKSGHSQKEESILEDPLTIEL